jgi:hypothetical protein
LGGTNSTITVSRADPFYSYYNNALGFGVAPSTVNNANQLNSSSLSPSRSSVTFGQPTYGTALTTTTSTTGRLGAAGASTAAATPLGGYPPAAGGSPVSKAPAYTVAIGFPTRPVPAGKMQVDLSRMLSRSTSLGADRRIAVATDGDVIVLRGLVSNDNDRRLAEAMVRLTPGVHDVRNEIQVR